MTDAELDEKDFILDCTEKSNPRRKQERQSELVS